MGLTNLEAALSGMSTEDLTPTPPPVQPDNTWDLPAGAIRVVIKDYFVPSIENRVPRGQLFLNMIEIARTQYNKTITRSQLKEIWQAWHAELAERNE